VFKPEMECQGLLTPLWLHRSPTISEQTVGVLSHNLWECLHHPRGNANLVALGCCRQAVSHENGSPPLCQRGQSLQETNRLGRQFIGFDRSQPPLPTAPWGTSKPERRFALCNISYLVWQNHKGSDYSIGHPFQPETGRMAGWVLTALPFKGLGFMVRV